MSEDRRELILARLFEVLQSVPGFVSYARNRGAFDDYQRPSLVMFDGDETTDENAFGHNREIVTPNLAMSNPEIYISLKSQKPENATAGQELNAWRVKILKAINSDSVLKTLCSVATGGEIQYRGCGTDLARGRNQSGEMGLDIVFVYELVPTDF
jgi:hypothetical protein